MSSRATCILFIVWLVASVGLSGCKRTSENDETNGQTTEKMTPSERTIENLQGTWKIDVENTLESAKDLPERDLIVAREMLSNLTMTIKGTHGDVTTRILGSEETQDWDLSIKELEGSDEAFRVCVSKGDDSEPTCSKTTWTDVGFRIETEDGLTTYYVPANEADEQESDENEDSGLDE